jgi:hypothetical protein
VVRSPASHLEERLAGIALDDGNGKFSVPMLKCALVQCSYCGFIMLHNPTMLAVEL